MKPKLSIGVCVLIALALVAFGFFYGTVAGFSDDRARVTALLTGERGLMQALDYRGADGLNLCVVARRHLVGDADVAALESTAQTLRDPKQSLAVKKQEDERLSAAVSQVEKKLQNTPGFQASTRDKAYLDMLTTDMEQLSGSAVVTTYNEAAADFNRQLDTPVTGAVAKALGVKPCEMYR